MFTCGRKTTQNRVPYALSEHADNVLSQNYYSAQRLLTLSMKSVRSAAEIQLEPKQIYDISQYLTVKSGDVRTSRVYTK